MNDALDNDKTSIPFFAHSKLFKAMKECASCWNTCTWIHPELPSQEAARSFELHTQNTHVSLDVSTTNMLYMEWLSSTLCTFLLNQIRLVESGNSTTSTFSGIVHGVKIYTQIYTTKNDEQTNVKLYYFAHGKKRCKKTRIEIRLEVNRDGTAHEAEHLALEPQGDKLIEVITLPITLTKGTANSTDATTETTNFKYTGGSITPLVSTSRWEQRDASSPRYTLQRINNAFCDMLFKCSHLASLQLYNSGCVGSLDYTYTEPVRLSYSVVIMELP